MRGCCGRLFGRRKGVKRPFGCYDGLSDVRKTSAGSAMTKVVLESVQLDLVPISLKCNQRYRDRTYLFVVCLCPF